MTSPLDEAYDVVIVGSGLGGASAAYKLSNAGLKVLMLERGQWPRRDSDDWNPNKILMKSRYHGPSPMHVKQYGAKQFKETPVNEVVGGMSVFFGGATFRLRADDFENWPISYQDMEPHYTEAEKLLEVHGKENADPLEPKRSKGYPHPPIAYNKPAQRIDKAAKSLGLKPFPIPMALNHFNQSRPICIQCNTCDGYPCKIEAKNDATTILKKARQENLSIVTGAVVSHINEKNGSVESLQVINRSSGKTYLTKGSHFILSANAMESPAIILRSNLNKKRFPHIDFVGRRLMRHCNMVIGCLFPFKTNPEQVFHKQLAISDFYEDFRETHGRAVGVIQDIYTPASHVVKAFAPRGLKHLAGWFSHYIQNLICVAEDEPQDKNRISLSNEKDPYGIPLLRIEHQYSEEDCVRRDHLVKQAKKILKRSGGLVSQLMKIDSFSHAVGTIRMGNSENSSVLDAQCRFHGIDNLYVLDGSFMPSSGGVNPSLTITSNSLRVSSIIAKQQGRSVA